MQNCKKLSRIATVVRSRQEILPLVLFSLCALALPLCAQKVPVVEKTLSNGMRLRVRF